MAASKLRSCRQRFVSLQDGLQSLVRHWSCADSETHRSHRWTLCHSLPTLLRVLRRPDPDAPLVHGSLHPAYFRDVTEPMLLPSCSHLPALRCSSLVMAMSDSLVVPPAAFCTLSEPILESPRLHHHVCLTHATASVRLAVCLTLSHTSPIMSRASKRLRSTAVCAASGLAWSTRPRPSQRRENLFPTVHADLHSFES